MNDIILNYIIQAILGAASGYITNDYAINMLFKEYTPLKIGGVIKKTRNEFIDNISSLVENDIINKEKLNKVLSGDKFIAEFEGVTRDFFEKCLYEAAGTYKFSQINGIDSSIEKTGEFIERLLKDHGKEIIDLLTANLKHEKLFTENQLNTVSYSLSKSIIDAADKDLLSMALGSLYSEKGNIRLSNILCISDERLHSLSRNLVCEINDLVKDSFTEKVEDTFKDIYKILGIDNAFLTAKNIFFEKCLKDIIRIEEESKNNASAVFIRQLNSEAGQDILYDLCRSLFLYCKEIDKTLFDITDSSFEINLKTYLEENLPAFTDNIVSWVYENGTSINKILQESIDELIDESDKIKAMLLSAIKSNYLDNLSEKYNVVGKITDFIKKEAAAEKLSPLISQKIVEYLSSKSIGEITAELENNNILNPLKLAAYITEYLNNYSLSIFTEILTLSGNVKIRNIIPESLFDKKQNDIKEIISALISLVKEKILSSSSVNDMLGERLYIFLSSFMNKNLNEIISENNANLSIREFLGKNTGIISTALKNELSKGMAFDSGLPNMDSSRLSDLISGEIMKQYNIYADRMKGLQISSALDSINRLDNLNKNSAEMIRSLFTKNMDTILSGSVKEAVSENLNKLSDDELVGFANDFIGRELQPIMYFGGILGAIAGIILAVIQNAPLDCSLLTVENMATYAFVGYLTNVVAINMIFKPYKENRLLSRIPFFKNFSLGYIVKNQKVFAETTARFVDNNLLSRESINALFEKYHEPIKNSLISGIKSGNYGLLHRLLNNNQSSIVSRACSFTESLINDNKENLSSFAFKSTKKTNASLLLTPAAVDYLGKAGISKLMHERKRLTGLAYNSLSSKNPLKLQIPEKLVNSAELYINNTADYYYDTTLSRLKDLNAVKSFVHRYEHKYISFADKYINEIAGSENIDSFGKYVSEKISGFVFSEGSKKMLMRAVNDRFAQAYHKNIGDIFGGKVKEYTENNMTLLFDRIFGFIKQEIIQSEKKISADLHEEIKNSLGAIEKGMFTLMGGKDIIGHLVHKVMVVKAPRFIDEKRDELYSIFSDTILKSFYNIKIEGIHKNLSKIQLDEVAESYFSDENRRELITGKISSVVNILKNKIEAVKLSSILKLLSIENTDSIFNAYGNEIQSFLSALSFEMSDKKDDVTGKIKLLSDEIINKFIGSISFRDIYGEISEEDIKKTFDNLITHLCEDDYLKKLSINLINGYKEYLGTKKISEFIDRDEFVNSLNIFIDDVLKDEKIKNSIKDIYLSALSEAAGSNFDFIDDQTKTYIIDIFVESGASSIKGRLDSILKAMEFEHIAKEEIENMEPEKIHEMFDSFMGKYFKRLMLYGFGGFVFGINMYVGLSLTVLKILGEKFFKK